MRGDPTALWTATVVATTVNDGAFLPAYAHAVLREGVQDRVTILVIPDRKTPRTLYHRCRALAKDGFRVRCPTLEEQDAYLRRLDLADFIPYDRDDRRNVGFLMALESGSDVLISIDDDNYCVPGQDFCREHAVVCSPRTEGESVASSTGWLNICDLLDVRPAGVWPRGAPYRRRHEASHITRRLEAGRVRLNAGLWLGEPDLDGLTWLVTPARAEAFKGPSVLLDRGTWTPVNTQNTALHRDLVVAFYYAPMGHPVGPGLRMERFGDILCGYLCQACVRHLGDRVRIGTPVVEHRRNSHDHLADAAAEMGGIWLMEDFAEWLVGATLQGSTYRDAYLSLAEALDVWAESSRGRVWTDETRRYLRLLTANMRRWAAACQRWL